MTGAIWMSFVATKTLIGVTPGPAVMLVLSHGLERGRSRWAALGIVLVNALYFVLASTGLGAVLALSDTAFAALKWAACVYLLFMGVRLLLGAAPSAKRCAEAQTTPWRSCAEGMLLQLANPHALLFFLAVLPTFLNSHERLAPQVIALGATGLALDCCILAMYGAFAERLRAWAETPEIRLMANRISGVLLILAGVLSVISW